MRQQYYERTWDAPSSAALNAALNALEAKAQFDGPQRKVSVRLADQDSLIYLDLADEFWRCVEIGAHGIEPYVTFSLIRLSGSLRPAAMADRRGPAGQVPPRAGMQPLPLPLRGRIN